MKTCFSCELQINPSLNYNSVLQIDIPIISFLRLRFLEVEPIWKHLFLLSVCCQLVKTTFVLLRLTCTHSCIFLVGYIQRLLSSFQLTSIHFTIRISTIRSNQGWYTNIKKYSPSSWFRIRLHTENQNFMHLLYLINYDLTQNIIVHRGTFKYLFELQVRYS